MKWRHSVASMFELISAICSWFVCQFRSRTELALEVVVLRHQLNVLRRQRPGRPRLRSFDRLLWVWLYRLWQRRLKSIALVKPATIVQWHRQGFRLFWRWRSRSGRPPVNRELRKLIREFSQATVAKYMVRRSGMPSPTWRSFLRNQGAGIAAIDMFVVVAASFRLLYVMVILAHDRRSIICIT